MCMYSCLRSLRSNRLIKQTIYHITLIIPSIVFPNFQIHQLLRHGWTSLVVEELRAYSLIALVTLPELKIVTIQKMWRATLSAITHNFSMLIIIPCMH